jgi:hypothetical protein
MKKISLHFVADFPSYLEAKASKVLGPAMPSTVKEYFFWKSGDFLCLILQEKQRSP